MTVVPPSDHLFVIFIFDAVFSHGRSGSVSGNVVDAIWGFHFKSLPKVCKVKTEPKTILFLLFL